MKSKILLIVLAALFVTSTAMVQAEDGTSKTGVGPGSVKVVDPVSGDWLLTAGATACQNVTALIPAHCASAGAGGVFFDIFHLESGKTDAVLQGELTVKIVSCSPCGVLNVTVANDRDDDNIITNSDPFNDDSSGTSGKDCFAGDDKDEHWTSCWDDDQWAEDEFSKPKAVGDTLVIPFCFAHDTESAGHDWDDIVIFLATTEDNPNQGTVELSLSSLTHVGDKTTDCSAANYENTFGTDSRPDMS